MSDGTITAFTERDNVLRAAAVLKKHKQSRKGTAYVVLTDKDHPNTKFEVEENKFNNHPKRYANRERVGNEVWK
jgi:hypothetical protein